MNYETELYKYKNYKWKLNKAHYYIILELTKVVELTLVK